MKLKLINLISQFLTKECPEKYVWIYPKFGVGLIFFSVIIYLMILVPFRFGSLDFIQTVVFSIYCGVISSGVYYIWLSFVKPFHKKKYLIIHDLFWIHVILIFISIFIYLFGLVYNIGLLSYIKENTKFFTFKNTFFYTYTIGMVFYVALFLMDYFFNNYIIDLVDDSYIIVNSKPSLKENNETFLSNVSGLNRNSQFYKKNNNYIDNKEDVIAESETENNMTDQILIIEGKNKDENFEIIANNFIYAKASGNYLDIVFFDTKKNIIKETIRNSITELLKQVDSFSSIIQIHRSYVVNLSYVISIQGTIKNTKLKLQKKTKIIEFPVARAKVPVVKSSYKSFKKQLTETV